MSNSIYETEKLNGQVRPRRQEVNPNPITFPALITGYDMITQNVSGVARRVYYYTWKEVAIKAKPTVINVVDFDGQRTSAGIPGGGGGPGGPANPYQIPGINGAEFGIPIIKESATLGVDLSKYPSKVVTMPAVHRFQGPPIRDGDSVETSIESASGPLVMMTLLRCVFEPEEGVDVFGSQFREVAFFYSASKIDGDCDESG